MKKPDSVIIHVPHASVYIPEDMQADFIVPNLQEEILDRPILRPTP